MEVRYYLDPESGLPHIYAHGVTEAEAEWVLAHPGEDEACHTQQERCNAVLEVVVVRAGPVAKETGEWQRFGGLGWVALAPYETFHPWWGRGAARAYGYNGYGLARGANVLAAYRVSVNGEVACAASSAADARSSAWRLR